jgi:putative colanic acid biosynthesis acetyltransferase WcaF
MSDALTTPVTFKSPHGFRNKAFRCLWGFAWLFLFRPTPKRLGGCWRNGLLRLFGAKVGRCWIHPSVRVWAPWKLKIGDDVYIDQGVWLYNAYGCEIKGRVIISAEAILCTASHDYTVSSYPLIGRPIVVESDCWITMRVFIAPGVTVGTGAVVGACAVVTKDVPPWTVVGGNPAGFIKKREIREEKTH